MIDDAATDNIVLEHMRRFRATQETMAADLHDVQLRMAHIERGFGYIHQEIAGWQMLISSLNSRINRLGEEVDAVAVAVRRNGERIGALETRMDALETRMDALETRMDALETRVGALETRMEALETTVAAGFTQVTQALSNISNQITQLAAR